MLCGSVGLPVLVTLLFQQIDIALKNQ